MHSGQSVLQNSSCAKKIDLFLLFSYNLNIFGDVVSFHKDNFFPESIIYDFSNEMLETSLLLIPLELLNKTCSVVNLFSFDRVAI